MHTAVNPYTAGLAVAGAGILTLSLVAAPSDVDSPPSHREVHPVQLAAVTAPELSTTVIDVAAAVTRAVTPPPSLIRTAAATSSSASSVDSTATTPTATSAASTSAASITTSITGIATGIFGIVADVGVAAAYLAILPPIWFVLTPLTFFLTGVATVILSGCSVNNCFTQAAQNFFLAPFVPTAVALQQAYQQATSLFTQFTGPFAAASPTLRTAAAAAPSTPGAATSSTPGAAAAATSSTTPTATVAGPRHQASATTPAHARFKSVATRAVDAGLPPQAAAIADGNNSPTTSSAVKPVSNSKTGKMAAPHRVAGSTGKHRKG